VEKILWIDLEMTGLDVDSEVIIETAAIATDIKLKPLGEYHSVVNQPQVYLDNMDQWNQTHHKESGLIDLIPKGKAPEEVEQELVDFVNLHFGDEKVVIAGNSISQDRLFIDRYFTNFAKHLHYRMLDVSSFKLVFNNMYNVKFEKQTAHRALDDIKESIAELQTYLKYIQA
jgi:oligoribonuclease